MRNNLMFLMSLGFLVILAGCAGLDATPTPTTIPTPVPYQLVDPDALAVEMGQQIFVPAYAKIPSRRSNSFRSLETMLAIHNSNADQSIVILAIYYHNDSGELVEDFVEQGWILPPLATATVIVNRDDQRGGIGASFTVEWVAESEVTSPIVEAIMFARSGANILAFTSRGVVVEEY